jgi:hypothetical protein
MLVDRIHGSNKSDRSGFITADQAHAPVEYFGLFLHQQISESSPAPDQIILVHVRVNQVKFAHLFGERPEVSDVECNAPHSNPSLKPTRNGRRSSSVRKTTESVRRAASRFHCPRLVVLSLAELSP